MPPCPYCKEEIQPGATICPHCRKKIETPRQKKFKAIAGIGLGTIVMSCMCLALSSMIQGQGATSPSTVQFAYNLGFFIAAVGIITLLIGLIGKGFKK